MREGRGGMVHSGKERVRERNIVLENETVLNLSDSDRLLVHDGDPPRSRETT